MIDNKLTKRIINQHKVSKLVKSIKMTIKNKEYCKMIWEILLANAECTAIEEHKNVFFVTVNHVFKLIMYVLKTVFFRIIH